MAPRGSHAGTSFYGRQEGGEEKSRSQRYKVFCLPTLINLIQLPSRYISSIRVGQYVNVDPRTCRTRENPHRFTVNFGRFSCPRPISNCERPVQSQSYHLDHRIQERFVSATSINLRLEIHLFRFSDATPSFTSYTLQVSQPKLYAPFIWLSIRSNIPRNGEWMHDKWSAISPLLKE